MQQNLYAHKQTQRLGAADIDASVGIATKKLQQQYDNMITSKGN
jgi:hypothetical protein